MLKTSKLIVIMSCYNQAHVMKMAIGSFLRQKTDFPVQLIVTDDCSTKDNSIDILREYEEKYHDKIKVLYNNENGGYLKNILRAKAITKSPYFTLLDADDYWTDDGYLQKAVDFLDGHPEFTIYNANVLLLYEDGHSEPYVKTNMPSADFSTDDFINGRIFFSQTTGMVFRNVIYANGIPDIVRNSIGTISERSYEGDVARYLMHLKYGKAHYVNEISGVYRILSTGIWAGLNCFEKATLQAQAYLDYDEYFERKYHVFFTNKVWLEIKECISLLGHISRNEDLVIKDEAKGKFVNCLLVCMAENSIINIDKPVLNIDKPVLIKKFRYRMMKRIYDYLKKKLRKKGYIN